MFSLIVTTVSLCVANSENFYLPRLKIMKVVKYILLFAFVCHAYARPWYNHQEDESRPRREKGAQFTAYKHGDSATGSVSARNGVKGDVTVSMSVGYGTKVRTESLNTDVCASVRVDPHPSAVNRNNTTAVHVCRNGKSNRFSY